MFEQRIHRTKRTAAAGLLEVIYVSTVRQIRSGPGSGRLGLLTNILQTVALIAAFGLMMHILGVRRMAIRGDFILYLMSGVFVFLLHTKTIKSVFGSVGPVSPMMQHAPMNTIVEIVSSALAALYLQLLSMFVILFLYHAIIAPITIDDPVGAIGTVLLAWFAGVAIGMVFLAAKPWAPRTVQTIMMVFNRANLVASGKMFVANTLPGFMLPFFIWNPLFHAIDQTRGHVFLNYNPHYTSVSYPLYVALALVTVGLMGEFFTRKHASISWNARS